MVNGYHMAYIITINPRRRRCTPHVSIETRNLPFRRISCGAGGVPTCPLAASLAARLSTLLAAAALHTTTPVDERLLRKKHGTGWKQQLHATHTTVALAGVFFRDISPLCTEPY